jgi:hypothetical protein
LKRLVYVLLCLAITLIPSAAFSGLASTGLGGTFGENFQRSFSNSLVNLAQADLQTLIGDRHNGANARVNGGEGSAGHVFEHALLGCLAGSALGGSCEASAAVAAVSALHAGAVDPQQALRNSGQAIALAELFGGLAAAVVSGGDTNATMIASGLAGSAFENNYLTHAQRDEFARALESCEQNAKCDPEQVAAYYLRLSIKQNDALLAAIASDDFVEVDRMRQEMSVNELAYMLDNPDFKLSDGTANIFAGVIDEGNSLTKNGQKKYSTEAAFDFQSAYLTDRGDGINLLGLAINEYGPGVLFPENIGGLAGKGWNFGGAKAGQITAVEQPNGPTFWQATKVILRDFWADERGALNLGGGASNIATAQKLADDLRLRSAKSPFTTDGRLTPSTIQEGRQIIRAEDLKNSNIPAGYGKYESPTFQSPSGNFKLHYYYNPVTKDVFYDLDYKVVFNHQGKWQ